MSTWDLTTYEGLKTAIADTLNRKDLSDQIPGFIALFEADANRKLRVRDMQTRVEATTDDQFIPLPADFAAPYSLQIADGTCPKLTFVGEAEAEDRRIEFRHSATPLYYTVFGSKIEIIPAPASDQNYELRYYARIPALTSSNASNWLLTKSPDLYLYGSLVASAPFLKNDTRLAVWKGLRDEILGDLDAESEKALRPQGSALRAKPAKAF